MNSFKEWMVKSILLRAGKLDRIKESKVMFAKDWRRVIVGHTQNTDTYYIHRNDVDDFVTELASKYYKRNFPAYHRRNLLFFIEIALPIISCHDHAFGIPTITNWHANDTYGAVTKCGYIYKDSICCSIDCFEYEKSYQEIYHNNVCIYQTNCECRPIVPEYMGVYIAESFAHLFTEDDDDQKQYDDWVETGRWKNL